MLTFFISFLTQTNINPIMMYIIMGLEVLIVLIRILLAILPAENKFHIILLRIFKGLKEIEDEINIKSSKDEDHRSDSE